MVLFISIIMTSLPVRQAGLRDLIQPGHLAKAQLTPKGCNDYNTNKINILKNPERVK